MPLFPLQGGREEIKMGSGLDVQVKAQGRKHQIERRVVTAHKKHKFTA